MKADRVAPSVRRIVAPNPGPKTLEGTNSYVVGSDSLVIIDPGPDLPDYIDWLAGWLRTHGAVRAILLTHGHPDHAGGAARLEAALSVPVCGSPLMEPDVRTRFHHFEPFAPEAAFAVDGRRLAVLPTPGHSFDHFSFFLDGSGMEDAHRSVLFSGDTILGRGTSLVARPEGDMSEYMKSLERLRTLRSDLIAPGHGPMVVDPEAKFAEYVAHREEREAQLLAELYRGDAVVARLVASVYGALSPEVRRLAELSVEAQLDKLEKEGRVERRPDGSYRHLRSS